jgi:hydroxymethylpyrimidine pyrophosphatase-like HAD family hydrolase
MKFSVLALDFDGTISRHDALDPDVRAAIGELRSQGIVVLLATGRILDDLRRVAGELHFVDAVVAENGAVVHFPESGYEHVSGDPPPARLLAALAQEGVVHDAGRVVVEADANDAPRILALIRRLELPLVLAFNRGRVMVLPQTLSKATGVTLALSIMRLSPHNAVAIGDAENDHQLLEACEVGVAVDWGSEPLKAVADYVLPGNGPPAVAAYIRALANRHRVPTPMHTRRRLLLGHTDEGRPLGLAVRGRNVLVAGDAKSGKSWVTGLLCEQLILYGYSLCVLDPEGDYLSLEALPHVTVQGGVDPLPRPRDLVRALRHADTSIVIDLSQTPQPQKIEYVRSVLPALATLRRHSGLPHRIVVDEAHYFLHDNDVPGLLDLELNGYTLVSYRASKVHRQVLAATHAVVVTRESDPAEVRALFDLCQACRGSRSEQQWERLLGDLAIGDAVVLPITEEAAGDVRRIRLTPRLTPHVRHMAKYIDVPVSDSRAFVFSRDGAPGGRRANTLREFVAILDDVPVAALDGHLRRGDFSRWIGEVFGDYPLAKTIHGVEVAYGAGRQRDVAATIAQAIRSRYDFFAPMPGATTAG